MGGQTGLNTALAVADMGVLETFGVELIGANRAAIEMAEDRKLFREAMDRLGIENPKATIANNMDECMAAIDFVGLPAIIRPAYTLGGTGGGVAYNRDDYIHYCKSGLDASPVSQILIDESLLGWKEFEMEVVRDRPTTPSSSAPSRTSTRWACIPATASPSRRRSRSPTRNTRSCATARSPCCARSGSRPAARTCNGPSTPRTGAWW